MPNYTFDVSRHGSSFVGHKDSEGLRHIRDTAVVSLFRLLPAHTSVSFRKTVSVTFRKTGEGRV